MNKHSRNTIYDRHFFFLGIEANVLLRIFYYNALGAFFESLVQRTGGCTNLLQGSSFYLGKASSSPNHYAIIRAKIYKTVKMMVVRRKFDFCSIFAKNIDGGYTLELILRVRRLYVSSNNQKKKQQKRPTMYRPFCYDNVGSKVH